MTVVLFLTRDVKSFQLFVSFPNVTPQVMHHIAGDLNSPQNLYLPSILKSFSKIWEQVIITIIILILILITIITILTIATPEKT